jgi:hypothetical protein
MLTNKDQKLVLGNENKTKLDQAKVILQENYTNAPSLAELSKLIIALNEFKLKKGFKSCFNCTYKVMSYNSEWNALRSYLKTKF